MSKAILSFAVCIADSKGSSISIWFSSYKITKPWTNSKVPLWQALWNVLSWSKLPKEGANWLGFDMITPVLYFISVSLVYL